MSEPKFELFKDYLLPKWSGKGSNKYFLEVIKNGVFVENKNLENKEFYLAGRYRDVCDIVLEHESISRKHAIVQLGKDNEIYVYDLGSTHGTFVNRKKIPSRVYHKLNVFDTIKFGQSSRNYIVRCTEIEEKLEEEQEKKEEEKKKKQLIQQKQLRGESTEDLEEKKEKTLKERYMDLLENDPYYIQEKKKKKIFKGKNNQQGQDSGISWGQVDESEIYSYQDQDMALEPQLLKRLPGLTEKQVEKIEKYEQKLNKYRGVEEQLESLAVKEKSNYGLDQKDQDLKMTLQSKTVELSSQVEQAEQNIRVSIFGEEDVIVENTNLKKQYEQMDDTFGDDEFYDRSFKGNQKSIIEIQMEKRKNREQVTTDDFWQLKKRLETLIKQRHEKNVELLNFGGKKQEKANKNEKKKMEEEEDELEKFMKENEENEEQENFERLKKQIKEMNEEIEKIKEMLQYVKPDVKINPEAQNVKDIFQEEEKQEKGQINEQKNGEKSQKDGEKQKLGFEMPQKKSNLSAMEKIRKQKNLASKEGILQLGGEDEDQQIDSDDDEKLFALANKQLQREKQYFNEDEEDELELKRRELAHTQYILNQSENQNNISQKVYDVTAQQLKQSKKKLKDEEKQKEKEKARQQYLDNIVNPFENEE
ncbi:SMAD/FHA domain [Pseudocohnilembus persalinus]|uniref:SMAD/FHA domain n=1 Tax=Pseudocohnilembus persalinus TaxID=266149 RepID=A0A0V0QMQ4_PSEPJ|nr:SMAD/FHA domain [Pseudocohnilembus persalinus]|eukprot:KRX03404.1 SMAD/FHA domain [Pseudocohnilembus persalinus]